MVMTPRVGYPREPAESPPNARTAGYTGRDEEKAPHRDPLKGHQGVVAFSDL